MKPLILSLLLVLALSGCGDAEPPAGPPHKLTIAEILQPSAALVYVADAKGYLKQAGLDVTFKSFPLGKDALNSVLAGEADLATVFQTPVVMRIYEGQSLSVVSSIFASTRNTKLVARADRGITTPVDLIGKRIGVTKGTTAEYFLSVFLATEGVPQDSVIQIPVEPAGYDQTLRQGSVDALVLFSPHSTRISRAMGENAILLHTDAYSDIAMLTGRLETIAARQETMARLMKALVKAEEYIKNNREDSIRIVVARLAGKAEAAEIRDGWDDFKFNVRLDNVLLASMKREAQWYRDHGKFSDAIPDFGNSIAAAPLRSVRAEAVTIQPATKQK